MWSISHHKIFTIHILYVFNSDDLDDWLFKLKIDTPVATALRNVHIKFGFCAFKSEVCTGQTDSWTKNRRTCKTRDATYYDGCIKNAVLSHHRCSTKIILKCHHASLSPRSSTCTCPRTEADIVTRASTCSINFTSPRQPSVVKVTSTIPLIGTALYSTQYYMIYCWQQVNLSIIIQANGLFIELSANSVLF